MVKDIQITVSAAFCDECGEDLHSYEGWTYFHIDGNDYCPDCAYKLKKITKKEWCYSTGICLSDRALKRVEIAK